MTRRTNRRQRRSGNVIVFTILLMVVNSFYETLFVRLTENRRAIRDLVAQVKRDLIAEDAGLPEGES